MTVGDLIKKLETLDKDLDVFIPYNDGQYDYLDVESVSLQDIKYLDRTKKTSVVIDYQ